MEVPLIWLLLACPHPAPPEPPVVPEPVVEAVQPPPEPEPEEPPPPSLFAEEVLDPTEWRRYYNQSVELRNKGEAEAAMELALEAVRTAPTTKRPVALEMLAVTAEEAGDFGTEFQALDALLEFDEAQWGIFWNGMTDAQDLDDDDRAFAYARRAVELCPDPGPRASVIIWTGLEVGELDAALAAVEQMSPGSDPEALRLLARALAEEGRCEEALELDPEAC